MINLDSSYTYRTYSAYLEGCPTKDEIYSSIKKKIEKLWGSRPTHFLKPAGDIPLYTHMMWLNSKAIDPNNHGSQLVVVTFSNDPVLNLDEIINSVDWEKHAEDFQY